MINNEHDEKDSSNIQRPLFTLGEILFVILIFSITFLFLGFVINQKIS